MTILNHINHKMPIYKDCTLAEVMTIAIFSLVILVVFFSLLMKLIFGVIWPGYLIASTLFFFATKMLLSKLQKLKYNKPYAYYQHLFIKKLSEKRLLPCRYIIRHGKWSVRRYL